MLVLPSTLPLFHPRSRSWFMLAGMICSTNVTVSSGGAAWAAVVLHSVLGLA